MQSHEHLLCLECRFTEAYEIALDVAQMLWYLASIVRQLNEIFLCRNALINDNDNNNNNNKIH